MPRKLEKVSHSGFGHARRESPRARGKSRPVATTAGRGTYAPEFPFARFLRSDSLELARDDPLDCFALAPAHLGLFSIRAARLWQMPFELGCSGMT